MANTIPPAPPGYHPIGDSAGAATAFGNNSAAIPAPPEGYRPLGDDETISGFAPANQTQYNLPRAPQTTPIEILEGVGEGAIKTGVGLGELANKVPGVHIPQSVLEKGKELATPGSLGEQAGQLGEEMGEWTAGEEGLKGLTSLAKLGKHAPEIFQLIEDYPAASKTILGMLKGGTVGAAQGGVKAAGEGTSAKEGAEGGALGGAIGSGTVEGLGVLKDFLGKKLGYGLTSLEGANRSLQPRKTDVTFERDWNRAAPTIGAKFRQEGRPADMSKAYEQIRDSAQDVWNSRVSAPIEQRRNDIPLEPLTGHPQNQDMIRDRIRGQVTPTLAEHFPKRAEFLNEFADRWGGQNPKTVGQINDEITQFNAELAAKNYWKSTPEERAVMEKTDPEVAAYVAASDELRDVLFSHLKASGVQNIDEDRKLYGALQHIGGEARSRINVEGRRPGVSGKEFVGFVGGALHGGPVGAAIAAAPIVERAANQPEKVLARAAEKSLPESAAKKVTKAVVGTTARAAAGVGGVHAAQWVTFVGGDGQTYIGHPEDWAEVQARDPQAKEISIQ